MSRQNTEEKKKKEMRHKIQRLFLLRRFLLYKSAQTESRVRGVFSASSSRRRRRFVRSNSSRASLRLFSREFFFSRSTFPAA
jgi:hypothetical protein